MMSRGFRKDLERSSKYFNLLNLLNKVVRRMKLHEDTIPGTNFLKDFSRNGGGSIIVLLHQ